MNDGTGTNPSDPSSMVNQGLVRNSVYNIHFGGQPYIDKTVKQGNFGQHDPGYLNKSFYAFGAKNTNVRDHFNPAANSLDASEYAALLNKKFENIKLKTTGNEKAKVEDKRNKSLSRYQNNSVEKVPNAAMNDYTKNISESIFTPGLYSQEKLTKYSEMYAS